MTDKAKKRCDQLFKLNMMFNGSSYIGFKEYNKDFNVHHTEIMIDTDDVWDTKIEKLSAELDKRKTQN